MRRVPSQHDRRRTYVQLVDDALDELLPSAGLLATSRVLFVCTHNSARSVLAEALWREVSDVPTASAGTAPAAAANPRALAAADRFGLPVAEHIPQSIHDVLTIDALVVSVCDAVNEELDPVPTPRIHWSIPDPAAVGTDSAFASTVDLLRDRVSHLAPRVRYRRSARTRKAHR